MKPPHPIPYQGSKRNLAPAILSYFPESAAALIEPFAGSAAITLAAAARGLAMRYVINDLNQPLIELWRAIIDSPERLARQYEAIWKAQHEDRRHHYDKIRDMFNRTGRPDCFLYLLARCVKAAVRYNANGEFNQSPDNRRTGALPATMREHILGASYLLRGKTECLSLDYREVVAKATPDDFIYMDPPYQGVCGNRDPRYLKSVVFDEFVEVLESLNCLDIKYLVSYDGRTGDRTHGRKLPNHLRLRLVELEAGRSSQATLLGRAEVTVESLYLSPALAECLNPAPPLSAPPCGAVGATGRQAVKKVKLPPDFVKLCKSGDLPDLLLALSGQLRAHRHAPDSPRRHPVDGTGGRGLRETEASNAPTTKKHPWLRERDRRTAIKVRAVSERLSCFRLRCPVVVNSRGK